MRKKDMVITLGVNKVIFMLKYNGGSDIKWIIELCDYQWVDLEELKK